ncbi:hypothetical protein ACQEU3_42280 [Spirillospora sp. CA-253888]
MRKIVITGMTAALALSLTACDIGNGAKPQPFDAATAPSGTAVPGKSEGAGAPAERPAPSAQQGGQQVKSATGRLRYLAPGKFTVGNVSFFTSDDTVLYVAGSTCPDGSTPPDASKCSVDGIDDWAKAAPHNVTVRFSGQTATLIRETQQRPQPATRWRQDSSDHHRAIKEAAPARPVT